MVDALRLGQDGGNLALEQRVRPVLVQCRIRRHKVPVEHDHPQLSQADVSP